MNILFDDFVNKIEKSKPLCPYCDEPISPKNKPRYDTIRDSWYCEACKDRYSEEAEEEEGLNYYGIRN